MDILRGVLANMLDVMGEIATTMTWLTCNFLYLCKTSEPISLKHSRSKKTFFVAYKKNAFSSKKEYGRYCKFETPKASG